MVQRFHGLRALYSGRGRRREITNPSRCAKKHLLGAAPGLPARDLKRTVFSPITTEQGYPMRRIFAAAALLSLVTVPVLAQETPATAPVATPAVPAAAMPAATPPDGATALCKDGTYSTSHHASGICADHKGMAKMLKVH